MKTKIAQVTIANAANQAEKNNQRVQLSYPAWEWTRIIRHYMCRGYGFRVAFDYEEPRSPFAYVPKSKMKVVISKTTDYRESYSLN